MHLNKIYKVALYGASLFLYNNKEKFIDSNFEIESIFDGDISKKGTMFEEYIIKHKLDIEDDFDYIFITSSYYNEIFNDLLELGIDESKILIPQIEKRKVKIDRELLEFNKKLKESNYEPEKINIKYYSGRRWESDLINSNFDKINFLPKKKIIKDNWKIRAERENIQLLKKK